jgi:hypothetical protein
MEKKARKQKKQTEGKGQEQKAQGIKQPAEKRTFIGSLVNADLWHRMRMLSLKEGKAAGRLLDMAMQDYLSQHGTKS